MAKGETKRTNAIIEQNLERDRSLGNEEREFLRSQRNKDVNRNTAEYDRFSGILGDRYTSGGLSPEDVARLRGLSEEAFGGGGGGGGYSVYNTDFGQFKGIEDYLRKAQSGGTVDVNRLREGQPTFRDIMQTGGFDPSQLASVGKDLGILQGFGVTGGLDPYSMDRMRGGGVYEEFADTGGYTDSDKARIRERLTSPVSAMFDADKREINRLGRVQGGYGGARTAALARSGRDRARGIADVGRSAEMDLADRVRQGRLAGASGLASSENSLQGLKTGNMLQGIKAALQFQSDFGQQLANNRMGGAEALTRSETGIQDTLRDEGRWGTENLFNYLKWQDDLKRQAVGEGNAAASAAASRASADKRAMLNNEWDIIDFMNQNRNQAMSGMGNLYSGTGNNIMSYSDLLTQERGLNQAGGNVPVQQRIQANPHWSEVFGQIAGPIASGVGAAAGAFQPNPSSRRRPGSYDYSDQLYGYK